MDSGEVMVKWGEAIEKTALDVWEEEGLLAMKNFLKETVNLNDEEIEEVIAVWGEGKSYPYGKLLSRVIWPSSL